jgi:glycerol-3-phosphate cytidylyltransferase
MSSQVVMTSGVFDLFHVGHLNILRNSKALGTRLIVGVVSDLGAAAYKRRPTIPQEQRLEIVRALRCVDEAYIQETTDPTPLLEQFRPDIYTHGNDWARLLKGQESIERLGIQFVLLPYTNNVSTSGILEHISTAQVGAV